MRRPLCYICVAFVTAIFIYLRMASGDENPTWDFGGTEATFIGEVYQKEYKGESLVLYLKQVIVLENDYSNQSESNQFYSNQFLKESVLSPYIKHNNENNIAYNSISIMCYIENDKKNTNEVDVSQVTVCEPEIGSVVAVKGDADNFKQARNPGEFDARQYYQILGLDFQVWKGEILAKSSTYSLYQEKLYQLRRYLEKIFDTVMPQKEASIMKAMVLGNKTELDSESKLIFQKSGISHILAISGLHISLIGMGLYKLLRRIRLPMAFSAVLSVVIMVMYGDMVGMGSSAFRAIFMFGMKLLAEIMHRTYDMLTALALAAVLLLLEQPLYLYHSGFLLSFGAILGIGCFGKSLGGGLSIFVIHFPIMLMVYYEFPVYSFLLNLIVIPAMTVVMALGILCLLGGVLPLGVLGVGAAYVLGAGCQAILYVFEFLCEVSLLLPGAYWITGRPDKWRIIVFYALIIVLFIFQEHMNKLPKTFITSKKVIHIDRGNRLLKAMHDKHGVKLVMYMLILTAVGILTYSKSNGLEITFVDVGQGDGIWIETPEDKHYMIDAGSTSKSKLAQYTLLPFLKYKGVNRLEAVFITHLDADHTSAITELLKDGKKSYQRNGIEIGCVVLPQAVIRDEAYNELVRLCGECQVPVAFAAAGDVINAGYSDTTEEGVVFTVLHPSADYKTESRNAYSLVMKLDYFYKNEHFGALFTGDVEADGELVVADYLKRTGWECDLFKASHHGSGYSNTIELLEAVRPEYTVVSCGEDNSYGHPHSETLDRLSAVGSKVLTTAEGGAVTVEVERKIKVKSFCVK